MRVKTDEKRQAILQVAAAVFKEMGYQRTSMAAISSRLGGSKATLYGYFSSKEELFAEAMVFEQEERGEKLLSTLDLRGGDLGQVLRSFGQSYLELVTQPDVLAHTRVAMSDGAASELGPTLYRLGPCRPWAAAEDFLEKALAAGMMKFDVPIRVAALQFKGLLESGVVEPLLFGVRSELAIKDAVENAVKAFLRLYQRD